VGQRATNDRPGSSAPHHHHPLSKQSGWGVVKEKRLVTLWGAARTGTPVNPADLGMSLTFPSPSLPGPLRPPGSNGALVAALTAGPPRAIANSGWTGCLVARAGSCLPTVGQDQVDRCYRTNPPSPLWQRGQAGATPRDLHRPAVATRTALRLMSSPLAGAFVVGNGGQRIKTPIQLALDRGESGVPFSPGLAAGPWALPVSQGGTSVAVRAGESASGQPGNTLGLVGCQGPKQEMCQTA